MDLVSIVILNFNGRNHLETFLPSVVQYSQGYPIIVADNCSSDDSVEFLKEEYPDIQIIRFDENHGFCRGYNLALARIGSEYCVLLNSDVEVTENWITPLLELMQSDPAIAACQPKILSYSIRNQFEYAGAGGGFLDYLGYPFCRGRIFTTLEEDHGQYDDTAPIFWASGACLFIRKDVFIESGGFDEDFFAHMEEIDLCWRLHLRGYGIWYCGESVIYHLGGGTLPKTNPQKTYLNFRNSLTILIKNHDRGILIFSLIARCVLDGIAILKFLIKDSWHDAMAVIKAHVYILSHLPDLMKKRKQQKSLRKGKFLKLYKSSIVRQYFLKGSKTYNDLDISNTR